LGSVSPHDLHGAAGEVFDGVAEQQYKHGAESLPFSASAVSSRSLDNGSGAALHPATWYDPTAQEPQQQYFQPQPQPQPRRKKPSVRNLSSADLLSVFEAELGGDADPVNDCAQQQQSAGEDFMKDYLELVAEAEAEGNLDPSDAAEGECAGAGGGADGDVLGEAAAVLGSDYPQDWYGGSYAYSDILGEAEAVVGNGDGAQAEAVVDSAGYWGDVPAEGYWGSGAGADGAYESVDCGQWQSDDVVAAADDVVAAAALVESDGADSCPDVHTAVDAGDCEQPVDVGAGACEQPGDGDTAAAAVNDGGVAEEPDHAGAAEGQGWEGPAEAPTI
jgi:hypothetical protein